MLNAEFNALVADILGSLVEQFEERVTQARRKLAGVQTSDMVLYAHLVAAYIDSDYDSVPNLEWILAVPGTYLEHLRTGVFPGDFDCLDRASMLYRAGVPAEMAVAARNVLFRSTSRGEWTYTEVVELHHAGVSADYVSEAGVILCGPKALARMFHAGVSAAYASALVARGVKPKGICEAWAAGIPLEYVVY